MCSNAMAIRANHLTFLNFLNGSSNSPYTH